MQTFLPSRDFEESARVLDYRRLGKQRVEVLQILNVLTGVSKGKGWANHPATRMWRGFENALAHYGKIMCLEWRARGYKDTLLERFDGFPPPGVQEYPGWMFTEVGDRLFSSHRAALLKKDEVWYSRLGWPEKPEINYVWPV